MPRKNLIRTNKYFYHITTRANHKHWFQLPLEEVWDISIKAFNKSQFHNPAIVSQYVLMSNHYHLLIRTPNSDIDQFMYHFNKTFSDLLRTATSVENRMFGSNYKWSLIQSDRYLDNVFRYIYQNPQRAGICGRCEHYPYSTYHFTHQKLELPFSFTPIEHLEVLENYINDPIRPKEAFSIKKGLRKTVFKIVKERAY